MRIINTVLGDATGGRWQVVLDYTNVLRELGHEVLLVAEKRRIGPDTRLPDQGDLTTIRNSGHYDLVATLKARRLLNIWHPDLIIAHCSRSVALFKRACRGRVKVVAVSHSNNVKRMARADAFFNISTFIGQEIELLGGEGKPAFHIPNMFHGPEKPEFRPRAWHEPVIIGALGRFDQVKGFHILLQAAAMLSQKRLNFRVLLGGDGPEQQYLEQMSRNLGISEKIEFLGWVGDVPRFYTGVDLLCVPALSDAFGLTPLDAAIYSTPLLLSDAPGHLDMFEDKVSAIYFRKEKPEALAEALEYAMADPNEMLVKSRKAFDRVSTEYTHKNFKERLALAVQDLTGDERPGE